MKLITPVRAPPHISIVCLLAIPLLGYSAQEDRISGPIDGSRVVVLKESRHLTIAPGSDSGVLDPSTPIHEVRMELRQTAAQAADLVSLLEAQRDPSSSDYHRWLTPEEFGERFGVSPHDLSRLTAWLESEGFTIQRVARAANWVAFSGSAGQMGKTFHTPMDSYQANGETHFANATEPSIPEVLVGLVSELRGLSDFHPKPPRIRRIASNLIAPNLTTSSGVHYLAPDDFAAIYDITALYQAGFDGTGQKVAIAGQTDINLADIRGFRAQFGLSAKDPQLVLYGTDPGVSKADQLEADLDLEWSGAVARNAAIIYVYSQDVFESVQYAIDANLAPVLSMSYSECELGAPASYRSMAQQANAEGMTWTNSSGDSGAAGCDDEVSIAVKGPAVTLPADIPEVTGVGGTEFNETGSTGWNSQNALTGQSATGYLPEIAWNDTALGGGIWASGGGSSVLFSKPWWQTGAGVPGDGARDVPDISLSASGDHDGYLIYAGGELLSVGGTSASAPSFAGIVALINQYVVAKGSQPNAGLGNINPNLYALAQTTAGAMHDVTAGNNVVPCKIGSIGCGAGSFGYSAGVGYDLATGLGSVDAYKLATNWASAPAVIGTTLALTASSATFAQSAATQLTAKITAVTGSAGPAGSVKFTFGGVALGSAAAMVLGTTASAVLSVQGSSLAAGSDNLTASYAPTGNFSTSAGSTTVTVTASAVTTRTTVTATPASIAAAASAQLTATVVPASGTVPPTGTVTFSVGSTVLGSAAVAASGLTAIASLTVKGASLLLGSNTVTVSYSGDVKYGASTSSALITVVAPPATTTTTTVAAASPATIAQNATTEVTALVKAPGSVLPAGIVNFAVGNVTLGAATLTASGGMASASVSVAGSKLALGSNILTASYTGSSGFTVSTGSVIVIVTSPLVLTKTSVTASPASVEPSGSTQLTVTVKAETGTAAPTGSVTFTFGATGSAPVASLGTAALSGSEGNSTATLTVKGASLLAGSNTLVATYAGSGSFSGSTGSAAVRVTGAAASIVRLALSETVK